MSAAPSLERDKAKLEQLAEIARRMEGDWWGMEADGETIKLVARRSTGEDVTLGHFSTDALPDEIELICGAFDLLLLLMRTRARAREEFRELRRQLGQEEKRLREGDFAANAAMHCGERPFQRFLEEASQCGPVRDKLAADTRLKGLLNITSKKQINEDAAAQGRWIAFRGRYEHWMRGG